MENYLAAMSLEGLPFPVTELSWEKLDVVATHLKLRKVDAFDLMTKLIGPHPGMDICLHLSKFHAWNQPFNIEIS